MSNNLDQEQTSGLPEPASADPQSRETEQSPEDESPYEEFKKIFEGVRAD